MSWGYSYCKDRKSRLYGKRIFFFNYIVDGRLVCPFIWDYPSCRYFIHSPPHIKIVWWAVIYNSKRAGYPPSSSTYQIRRVGKAKERERELMDLSGGSVLRYSIKPLRKKFPATSGFHQDGVSRESVAPGYAAEVEDDNAVYIYIFSLATDLMGCHHWIHQIHLCYVHTRG